MPAVETIQTSRFTIDTVSWTPITAPFDCNFVSLFTLGTSAIKLRTDDGNPNTEVTVAVGSQWAIETPMLYRSPRFASGATIIYAQATSGTGPVCLQAERESTATIR